MSAALRVGSAGFLTMFAVQLLHELASFGWRWGFLTGEREGVPGLYPFSLGDVIGVNVVVAGFFALVLAGLGAVLLRAKLNTTILGIVWLALCIWGLFGTAQEYRGHFGATWLWHEPFLELMWSPVWTTAAVLVGLSAFMWAIRRP